MATERWYPEHLTLDRAIGQGRRPPGFFAQPCTQDSIIKELRACAAWIARNGGLKFSELPINLPPGMRTDTVIWAYKNERKFREILREAGLMPPLEKRGVRR